MKLRIKAFNDRSKELYENHSHFHSGDAGLDLFVVDDQVIPARSTQPIPLQIACENLDNKASTGIATFSYFPNSFGDYISKLNCFCYDAQTLKPKQKDDYSFVILIDLEVTKDSKTKQIKEVTIQFTFFDYKKYKENNS